MTKPLVSAPNSELAVDDNARDISIPPARLEKQPIKILIVDDEPKNLTVLETVLDDPGYVLVRAESADAALLALLVEEFALLILDISMPGVTGFELAQMVKERKKTAHVPIIFLTAYYNEDQHVLEGYDSGAVDYLLKPVNPVILRSKVAIFAELHRKSRETTIANRALVAEIAQRRRVEEQLLELNATLEQRVAERTEALRSSEERLRLATDAAHMGLWDWNLDTRTLVCTPQLEMLFGFSPGKVKHDPARFRERIHADDVDRVNSVLRQAIDTGLDYSDEFRVIWPDDSVHWLSVTGIILRDGSSRTGRVLGISFDITARKRAETALRDSERQFREMVDALPAAVYTTDALGRLTHFNPACIGLAGREPELGKDVWCVSHKLYESDGTPLALESCPMAVALKGGSVSSGVELILERPDGVRRRIAAFPVLLREDECIIGGIDMLIDITEQRDYENHIKLLMAEVNHRAKNMLSVVQAVARQTLSTNPKDFVERFSERVQSLAASHDLLVNRRWQGIPIADLFRAQLAHFEDLMDTRVKLEGPDMHLSIAAAQSIGMVIHELATNAAKHGALSNESGHVHVVWGLQSGDKEDRFTLSWTESGGPPVATPHRTGFGSTVLKSMAEMSLDGEVQLEFALSGVRWRIECSTARALDSFAFRSEAAADLIRPTGVALH